MADRIRTALDAISASWDDTLEPARRGTGPHTTGTTNPPLPLPAATLDVRAQAHERLAYWAQLVIRDRKLQHLTAVDPLTLTAFLHVHADWLATHKWAHHARTELEHSARNLTQIATDSIPKQLNVGSCPGTNNGRPCTGIVKATIRADDDKLPSEMACDATPQHSWPASEWRTLRRRLHADIGAARRLTITRLGTMDMAGMMRLAQAIDSPQNRP